ncbi:hypothetical protein [Faecalibacillus intestinalis]|uniref:hypothetical protein n=1 Tax=Faecalibacillus intestinalis TaxID=1982626 RepID=UPI0035219BC9
MKIKKLVVSFVCMSMIVFNFSTCVDAKKTDSTDQQITLGEKCGYLTGNYLTDKRVHEQRKFTWGKSGKGYVAEQANNLSDRLHGKKAVIIGNDNVLNGADRSVINRDGTKVLIQDKYYSTANNSVNAAFDSETGMYKYTYGKNDQPMILEIPKGQGKKAIEIMEDKIKNGFVKGINDPNEAKNLIKEGVYTFDQAKQIAKFGNIDSLKYDAKNGTIIALGSMGLSFTLDFASEMIAGNNWQDSLEKAGKNALKSGVGVGTVYVLSSQLAKAKVNTIFTPTSEKIANLLGNNLSNKIVTHFGEYGQTCTVNAVSTILQHQFLTETVALVVFTVPDVVELFSGRISSKQLLINLAILIGGSAGATLGMIAGSYVGPVGSIAGGLGGGYIGSYTSKTLLTTVFKEDADEMYDIIKKQYSKVSQKYLVSQKEADEITDSLSKQLSTDTLKSMYESKDRTKFANKLIRGEFKNQINKRKKIEIPTQEQVRKKYKNDLGNGIYIH